MIGLLALACAEGRGRPDPAGLVYADPQAGDELGPVIEVEPTPCEEFCGETFLTEALEPPNLYFVIDRSGSMGELVEGSSRTKLQTARAVIGELLGSIGHRVRYGGAVFPSFEAPEQCLAGTEFFEATLGAPPSCERKQNTQLSAFLQRLGVYLPQGGTPTALTLEDVRPRLEALEGKTAVVLVTDGAPNCDVDGECEAGECSLNIEGARINGNECNASFNCCDPENGIENANAYCVDDDGTEAAVRALAKSGISTYVVGMPGAEPYEDLLERLAKAGGEARGGDVAYYATTDEDELRDALYAIGTAFALRCEIDLAEPPEDGAFVNVYFDGQLVPADADDGWSWEGDTRIIVNGSACDDLRSGEVRDARAVFGCETVVR